MKYQVDRLRNKKVTIYRSALSYKKEGASLHHFDFYARLRKTLWVSFAPEFQCCYFCEPSCLFYLSFNFDFYVSKIMHL